MSTSIYPDSLHLCPHLGLLSFSGGYKEDDILYMCHFTYYARHSVAMVVEKPHSTPREVE